MKVNLHSIRAIIKLLKRNKSIIKITIAVVLTIILFFNDKLSLSFVNELSRKPEFWIACIFGNMLISAVTVLRWNLVIRRQVKRFLPYFKLFQYNWASVYVGLAFLGTIGTDSCRISALHNNQRISIRKAAKSIFWDRIFSLVGLISLAVTFALQVYLGWGNQTYFLIGLCLLSLIVPEIFLTILSNVLKASLVCYLYYLSIGELDSPFSLVQSTTFGLAVEAIPISWQGLGTGHIGFEYFIGESGADLFSSYLLGRTVYKMIGIFFFLGTGLKKEMLTQEAKQTLDAGSENPDSETDPTHS